MFPALSPPRPPFFRPRAPGLRRRRGGGGALDAPAAVARCGSVRAGVGRAFDEFIVRGGTNDTNVTVDVTRIASYVAAGVGFIGGGAIVKHAGTVRGITTAASLWSSSAIGLSAGLGFWVGAVTATVVSLVALSALKPVSNWVGARNRRPRSVLVVVDDLDRRLDVVRAIEEAVGASSKKVRLGGNEEETNDVVIEFWNPIDSSQASKLVDELHQQLGAVVRSVTVES